MNKSNPYLVIGKIGATYGVKGWLKIYPFSDTGSGIFAYKTWFLADSERDPAQLQPITIAAFKPHQKAFIAKLSGVEAKEDAQLLTGKTILIKRDQLPTLPENEFYWSDLIGLTVFNQKGEELGPIIYLIATGSNDVLVTLHQGKEFAIPYLPSVVVKVDLKQKQIIVNWDLI